MLKNVRSLIENGFAVHLLRPRSKIPIDDGWSKAQVWSFAELQKRYREDHNVGVRLGKPSKVDGGYLHAIDMDIRIESAASEALDALKKHLPSVRFHRLPCVRSGSIGGTSRHYYFISKDAFPSRKIAHSSKKVTDSHGKQHWSWELELFGTGKQIALPPSIHPETGNAYKWLIEPDFEIGIPEIRADIIGDLVFAKGATDEREPDTMQPLGVSFGEAEDALRQVRDWADDHETWRNVGMMLKHEFGDNGWGLFDEWSQGGKGYDRNDNRAQWRGFKIRHANPLTMRTLMQEVRSRELLSDIAALPDTAATAPERPRKGKNGDPDTSLLQQSRVAAPELPLDIFGPRLAREIERLALNAAAPVDFVAAAILCGASAVIGNAARVEVKPGFVQAPVLWAQVIGPPSSKKSPALRIVTTILNRIENRYEPFYQQRLRKWERDREVAELRLKTWKAKINTMLSENKDVPSDPPDDCQIPPEPTKRQFILNDLTIEAFMRAQVRNPRGFMVFRDELAGWLGNMERYSAESERGAWLESYDGGSYAIERVKEGNKTLRVRHLCAPVLGGIQPERLLSITAQSVVDDGLQARFMPFWPEYRFVPMSTGMTDDTWLTNMFQKLSELRMDKDENGNPIPFVKPLSRGAFQRFKAWSDRREQDEIHTPSRLAASYGKATGQVARVAIVLEYLWWANNVDFDDDGEDPPARISIAAVEAAIRFRETYLKEMQRRVYMHAIEAEEVTNARLIAEWIVNNEIETLNARTVRREAGIKGISTRTDADVVDAALAVLVSLNWIHTENKESTSRGGRPPKNFIVNPRLWEVI